MPEEFAIVKNGWYSHPNIGLMRVYQVKSFTKYCPIRKDSDGGFVAMRPNMMSSSIAKNISIVPIPPNFILDKKRMPSALKEMYHDIMADG